jgi:predicted DNA binding CopG/RHH family protein
MEQTIVQLLQSAVEKEVKGEVEKAKEKWRQQIQDLVRNLTGLRLTHLSSSREAVRLVIRVAPGLPKKVIEKIKSDVGQTGLVKEQLIREHLSFHKATLNILKDNCMKLLKAVFLTICRN